MFQLKHSSDGWLDKNPTTTVTSSSTRCDSSVHNSNLSNLGACTFCRRFFVGASSTDEIGLPSSDLASSRYHGRRADENV